MLQQARANSRIDHQSSPRRTCWEHQNGNDVLNVMHLISHWLLPVALSIIVTAWGGGISHAVVFSCHGQATTDK